MFDTYVVKLMYASEDLKFMWAMEMYDVTVNVMCMHVMFFEL